MAGEKRVTREEFEKMNQEFLNVVAADEKRLGIGSEEFKQRHNEIMELIEQIRGQKQEDAAARKCDNYE